MNGLERRRAMMGQNALPADVIIYRKWSDNDAALMDVIYAQKWSKSPLYMTKREAEAVTDIGTAFRYNESITNFEALQYFTSVKTINSSFEGCTKLQKVILPNNVQNIYNTAFKGTAIKSIFIPKSVVRFNANAFTYCGNLETIEVDQDNGKYDSRDGCNAIIETSTNIMHAGCKNTIIPNTVTHLYTNAFAGCTGLTSIEIPNSIRKVGFNCFADCTNLTRITLSRNNTIVEFANGAFNSKSTEIEWNGICLPECTSMGVKAFGDTGELVDKRIYLPKISSCGTWAIGVVVNAISDAYLYIGENATSIGYPLVPNQKTLTMVCMAKTPPAITSANTFPCKVLYVPRESIETYKNTEYWKNIYKEEIKAVEDIDPNLLAYMKFETDIKPT